MIDALAPLTGFESRDLRWLLESRAARRGDAPFLVWEPFDDEIRRWSYVQFLTAVRRFAGGLVARGVTAGDRVAIHMDNCPEFLIAWMGCAYAGAVAVTTNGKSSREELAYYLEHSRSVAAVTQPAFASLVSAAGPGLAWVAVTGEAGPSGFDALYGAPDALPARPMEPLAPFSIQYTSGTTARPKAVLWTHANALWGGKICAAHEALTQDDVHMVYLPLFHTNAQCYSVLAALWAGATVVLQPRFSASRFWPVSLRNGCTWSSMIPFCLKALAQQERPQQHSYRLWGNGICAPATDALFGVRTLGWWGMTETITHGTIGDVDGDQTSMSMGRPAPEYGIRIENENGQAIQPGETGDLLIRGVRGVSMFQEYVDNPEATAAAFRPDGYFITGDRARLAEDGSLFFGDRSKDMLKVGGENVAASEIERVVSAVAGVREVAVVAKRHPMLDEAPVAFVIAFDAADTTLPERILAACEDTLASFKRPHEVLVVEEFPRSTLEKVAKAELRALLARRERA